MTANTPSSDCMLPRPATITQVNTELEEGDVFTWTLAADPTIDPGAPGQFNMLYAFGAGEVPISISGWDADGRVLHTIRAVGRVTRAMAKLTTRAGIGIRGPFGQGWPLATINGRELLVIAGGLGLAPVRPLLQLMEQGRIDCSRLRLYYGARSPRDVLFRDDLQRWASHPAIEVQVTVDRAGPDWRGEVGVVPQLLRRATCCPDQALAFICGPEIMMRFCIAALQQQGFAAGDIYLSMERSMKCAVGLCGRCQWRESFICQEGPVFDFDQVRERLEIPEL